MPKLLARILDKLFPPEPSIRTQVEQAIRERWSQGIHTMEMNPYDFSDLLDELEGTGHPISYPDGILFMGVSVRQSPKLAIGQWHWRWL